MPISRFVAVSLRPASSVRSRTLASTGRVLRLETALETTERPRARFSCMTESFTSGCLQVGRAVRRWPVDLRVESGTYLDIHHHRHHGVDTGDGPERSCGERWWTTRCARWMAVVPARMGPGSGGGFVRVSEGRPSVDALQGRIRPRVDPRSAGPVSTRQG